MAAKKKATKKRGKRVAAPSKASGRLTLDQAAKKALGMSYRDAFAMCKRGWVPTLPESGDKARAMLRAALLADGARVLER